MMKLALDRKATLPHKANRIRMIEQSQPVPTEE
jgi:hypothetical protein